MQITIIVTGYEYVYIEPPQAEGGELAVVLECPFPEVITTQEMVSWHACITSGAVSLIDDAGHARIIYDSLPMDGIDPSRLAQVFLVHPGFDGFLAYPIELKIPG